MFELMRKYQIVAIFCIIILSSLANGEVVSEEKNPLAIFGKFILWFAISAYTISALRTKRLSSKAYYLMLVLSLLIAGFLLGADPSSVGVIQDTLVMLAKNQIFMPRFVGLGVFLLFIVVAGRLFCGICCPFGILQELASRLGPNKIKLPNKSANIVRGLFFLAMVLYTFAFTTSFFEPITPFSIFNSETLKGNLTNNAPLVGLFLLFAAMLVYRPFCRLMCPYGFIANIFTNKARLVLARDDKCIDCGACVRACPTQQAERGNPHKECYYCIRCIRVCPAQAILLKRAANPPLSCDESRT
jgi:polyferredoxin